MEKETTVQGSCAVCRKCYLLANGRCMFGGPYQGYVWQDGTIYGLDKNMEKFKSVTPDEFDKFIENYPRHLEIDVYRVPEPPLQSWNDFSLGDWPESVVASASIDDDSALDNFRIVDNYSRPMKQTNWKIKQ